jgi:hypothetical protein
MGLDIGGTFTIGGPVAQQALSIYGAASAFEIDNAGRTYYKNQIGFIAGYNTDPGWIAQPASTWYRQPNLNNTVYNKGGG